MQYCECYAGGVKCSPSCRCMGCKNMGTGPFLTIEPHPNMMGMHHPPPHVQHAYAPPPPPPPPPHHIMPRSGPPAPRASAPEPWLAAQNLTYLKRSSPTSSEKKRKNEQIEQAIVEIQSMPSLASSSEGTSPGDGDDRVNSLLLAAYAMTEFADGPEQKKSKKK